MRRNCVTSCKRTSSDGLAKKRDQTSASCKSSRKEALSDKGQGTRRKEAKKERGGEVAEKRARELLKDKWHLTIFELYSLLKSSTQSRNCIFLNKSST